MNPTEFVKTIYLGDRACKAIIIDGWNSCVRLQVDCISRVRDMTGKWDFYTEEDVSDGFIVFDGVGAIELRNAGHVPNDSINSFVVLKSSRTM